MHRPGGYLPGTTSQRSGLAEMDEYLDLLASVTALIIAVTGLVKVINLAATSRRHGHRLNAIERDCNGNQNHEPAPPIGAGKDGTRNG